MGKTGLAYVVLFALLELLGLAGVPVLDRPVVAGNTAVDLGGFTAFGAGELLAVDVSMIPAYGVCRGERVIRKLVILRDLADKGRCCFPARQLFTEEGVEDGS